MTVLAVVASLLRFLDERCAIRVGGERLELTSERILHQCTVSGLGIL